jgi:D-alanyl-D-alanine endopeptidase (penicillin-binding protein 7)
VTVLNVLLFVLCTVALWPSDTPAVSSAPLQPMIRAPHERGWTPPTWFPEESREELWVLEDLDGEPVYDRGPRLRSPSAIIADLDRGEVLWAHDADSPRTVASLTKMVSSLAMSTEQPDLDQELCVDWELWPSRSGARSRFETGVCHQGWEFLGAAMVASDNRGAMALPRLAGLEYYSFVERMGQVSRDLRLEHATWADPSGLEDENMATARDMLKAVVAVSAHPTLSVVGTAPRWRIERKQGPQLLGSTNRLVNRWETLAAKTGYTDTAHYCFATVMRTRTGRRLAVAVLGAPTVSSRFSDVAKLVDWVEDKDESAR